MTQTSARDLNITSRGATGTLSTTQLALIDGRSVYLDFFGFVGWDFLPVNFAEIKQVEVIRGPASAIWGANAMTGVVNIITKAPREMQGTSITMGFGTFNRDVDGQTTDPGNGGTFYTNLTHARAINDRWSYKVSAAFYGSDPFARPVGTIDNSFSTPYPAFSNTGTEQPKFDGRVDYDFADGMSKLVVAGGYAGTSGIIHTGIGPFQIEQGTNTSYVKGTYTRNALRAQFFTNILDGTAPALLSIGVDGKPIQFAFNTKTYDFDLSNISTIGTRHVLSYGGNVRHNGFDLSIAPLGSSRNEQGVYIQDEMFLSQKFRWQLGVRMDHFDVLEDVVFSPRTTVMFKPQENQTIRASYNKAYRAPSLTNNFLDVTILNQLDLGALNPAFAGRLYTFPVEALGNQDLRRAFARRVRDRLLGRDRQSGVGVGGVVLQHHGRRNLLHAGGVVLVEERAARLAAAAVRARPAHRGQRVRARSRPALGILLSELERSRRMHGRDGLRRRCGRRASNSGSTSRSATTSTRSPTTPGRAIRP